MSKGAGTYNRGGSGSGNSSKNKSWTFGILGAAILVTGIFLLYHFFGGGRNWNEIYHKDAKSPYGGYVFAEMLKKSSKDSSFFVVDNVIFDEFSLDTLPENSTYVYLGNRHFLDSAEAEFIKSFVSAGHDAYIICKGQNTTLLNDLISYEIDLIEGLEGEFSHLTSPMHQFRDSVTSAIISPPSNPESASSELKMTWISEEVPKEHSWRYFKNGIETLDGAPIEAIGLLDGDNGNCIVVPHGEGRFILHSTPEIFTNFFMRDSLAYEYANTLFSDMGNGTVIWDENNRMFQDTRGNAEDLTNMYEAQEGALSFILSQPKLRRAWYIMLLTVALYLLFGARRTQRVVPVLKKNANTSIRYSETVGQIYMQQKDHRSLALLKLRLFLAFIRDHYNLKTTAKSREEQQVLIKTIALKSDIDMERVERIFRQRNGMQAASDISVEALVELHRQLEYFYNNCK